jgi:hypothetical protein
MYRFGSDSAGCFRDFAKDLAAEEALAALWLAGRLDMPALQLAAASRLDEVQPGEDGLCVEQSMARGAEWRREDGSLARSRA